MESQVPSASGLQLHLGPFSRGTQPQCCPARGLSVYRVVIGRLRWCGSWRVTEESVPGSDGLRDRVLLLEYTPTDLERRKKIEKSRETQIFTLKEKVVFFTTFYPSMAFSALIYFAGQYDTVIILISSGRLEPMTETLHSLLCQTQTLR